MFKVAQREVGRLFTNKLCLFCIFVAPLFSTFFFLSLMQEGLPTNLPIALVDMDGTATSRSLARQLDAFEGSEIVAQYTNFTEARHAMQRGDIYGIFFIPAHFTELATSGKQPKLSFYTNNSYLIAGSLLFKDMKTAATLASGAVVLQTSRMRGLSDAEAKASVQPVVVETHPVGNPWLNYSVYLSNILIPGLLALLVMSITVYSIGIEIKEKTAAAWLATGNGSFLQSLLGKLLPHTLLFFTVGLLIFACLYIWMGFPVNGSITAMVVALLLLILSSQAMGVFMIGCFPTLRLGLSFACIWGMISFSISGFSFPVDAMYAPIQALSNLFPLRHYFLIYVDQALNARALFYAWPHYMALLAFLVLPFFTTKNLQWSVIHQSYQP
jgi:ABC-2 type transport system permease protein